MTDAITKPCARCKEVKPLDDFHRHTRGKDGRRERCATCICAQRRAYYQANREAVKARSREWYSANRERARARQAAYTAENRDRDKDARLRSIYGVGLAYVAEALATQGGCAICHTGTPTARGWVVDHDHVTGKVRGVLCSRCNTGIGMLGDTVAAVEAALIYLRAA